MIIDVFKDRDFFLNLEKYNKEIEEVCATYRFSKDGNYDLANRLVSKWFDPKCRRELHISEFYPHQRALQHHSKFNLILHYYNCISLYVINLLYKDDKSILIEDLAGGMGKLFFYLSKLGFNKFHNVDNFSQTCESMFTDLMEKGNIAYNLNNYKLEPTVINLSALPIFLRYPIPKSTELICCYYHDGIIRKEGNDYTINFNKGFDKIEDFEFLCKDSDNLTYFFCRKSKYKEFYKKIKAMERKSIGEGNILQYEPLHEVGELKSMSEYLETEPWFTEFKKSKEFTEEIRKVVGVQYCYLTNNGTISLALALLALGVKRGDTVLVPNLTMIATANAVRLIGAEPVLVDVTPENLCMNPNTIIDLVNSTDVKAVIYVSLNGRWDTSGRLVDAINFCREKKVGFIEDAAQSFGSRNYRGNIGVDADISSFSFSPAKIITTGQGGCLVTDKGPLAEKIRVLRDFGRLEGGVDNHPFFGINTKFTDLQAVIGLEQIKNIEYRLKRKKEIYKLYEENLKDVVVFIPTDLSQTVPWFIDVYFSDINQKNDVMLKLKERGIGTRPVYPTINSQGSYSACKTNFYPVSKNYSERGLWLPSSLTLTDDDVITVCNEIKAVVKEIEKEAKEKANEQLLEKKGEDVQ